MKQRIREVFIFVVEKVYCVYFRCFVLMLKGEIFDFVRRENVGERMFGVRKCMKCYGLFCVNCKVSWYENMICKEYKRLNFYLQFEDVKFKIFVIRNLWCQCVKCNYMIELVEGCYYMMCRYLLFLNFFCEIICIWCDRWGFCLNIIRLVS